MIPPKESIRFREPDELVPSKTALIDVRSPEAFAECHIEDSLNICVYEVTFIQSVKSTFPDGGTELIVYGESEHFHAAAVAAGRLKDAGFAKAQVLRGGLKDWIASGRKVVKSEAAKSDRAGTYELNAEKSKVRWIGRNLANQHEGEIACRDGNLKMSPEGAVISGRLEVDMKRISCGDISDSKLASILIQHLESADFFEAAKYPTAQFLLDRVFTDPAALPGSPNARIEGRMQIRGHEQSLHLECTFEPTDSGYVLQTQFDLDRTRFGAVYGSGRFFERLGMHLVNDLVNLQVTAFFEKAAD